MLPTDRPKPAPGRSFFDLSGKFHDFQSGPKIARPNLFEESIPVIGPAWDALADVQDGNYGSAAFNVGMAGMDLLPIGYGLKAVRTAAKITKRLGTIAPKSYAVQRKMHQMGIALPGDEVHHVLELAGLPRNIPLFRNNPLVLKVLPKATHRRLHGRWQGQEKFDLPSRLYHGTTAWMKAGAAGMVGDLADTVENIAVRPGGQAPSPSRITGNTRGMFPRPSPCRSSWILRTGEACGRQGNNGIFDPLETRQARAAA